MRNTRLGDARDATEMDDARCASDIGDVRGATDSEMDDDAQYASNVMIREMRLRWVTRYAATRLWVIKYAFAESGDDPALECGHRDVKKNNGVGSRGAQS